MRPTFHSTKCGLLLGSLLLACAQAGAAPGVSLVATPSPVVAGSSFTLDVNAAGFTDLYAWQLSVKFDPTLFQAKGAAEGDFLGSAGATFFDAGSIDNVGGTVSFSFDTLVGAVPGANGSGLLERLTFQSLATGTGRFSLDDVAFLDSNLGGLAPITAALSVSAVPEPATSGLILAGLVLLLGLGRRRPG